jgi:hypothetical protein
MSDRHADTFNKHVLKYQLENPDKYLLLDSDMFLIDYFDIKKYSDYECAIVLQNRDENNYLWPGLIYMDFTRMKNKDLLNWSCCPGMDSGGMMKYWLDKQIENHLIPNTNEIRWTNQLFHTNNVYFIKHLWSCSWDISEIPENVSNKKLVDFFINDVRNKNGKFFCEIYDNVFLHYRAGGNWMNEGMDIHKKLSKNLKKILLESI